MDSKEVKDFLQGYQKAKRKYGELLERLNEIETIITGISFDYSNEKVQSSPINYDDNLATFSDLRTDCINAATAAIDKMEEVCSVIDKVEGTKGEILHKRYILGKHWEEIAVEMHYNYRTVTKLHGKALPIVAEILERGPTMPH